MAEVPEHLLQRSAARRAALTGGAAPEGGAAPATTGESAPAAAGGAAPAAPPKVTPTQPAFIEPVNKKEFERVSTIRRRRIPAWAMGVLAIIPLWGVLYIGAFGPRPVEDEGPPDGSSIFANNCSSCHGATGGGGVGPKLAGGEVTKTFPDKYADGTTDGVEAHIDWVTNGSGPHKGQGYGDPAREGGLHIAATGGMPAFGGQLSPEEIEAVVTYEREGL